MSQPGEEPESEFSYTQSDVLHQHPEKQPSKNEPAGSTYSSDSRASTVTPAHLGFQPPNMPHHREASRDSYISHLSQYSERENNVAEPVSVTVVDQAVNPVNKVTPKKLETVSGSRQDKVGPDVIYNTNIESTVPPRSNRRPVSEYVTPEKHVPLSPAGPSDHQRRVSLAISDDLDKLMERANSITSKHFNEPKTHIKKPSLDSSVYSAEIRQGSNINSLESFMTASDVAHSPSPLEAPKRALPPRPTAENIVRAREVSSQMERKSQRSDSFGIEELSENDSHDEKTTTYGPDNASQSSEVPLMSQVPDIVAPEAHEEVALISSGDHMHSSSSEPLVNEAEPVTVSRANSAARRVAPRASDEQGSSDYDDVPEVVPQPIHDGDDQFYDVDEPILSEPPTRAKSVKDSTKHPKKLKKTKKKRVKSSASGQLKPFSYNTLISLLESINGTIIGEEFDQLNLPIKEKQLIEKIIDSLSRLTSDMVLDEQRYEIGITRLETALRVLEGFM